MSSSVRVMLAENKPWNEAKVQALIDKAGHLVMQPKIDGMRMHSDDRRVPLSRSGKEFKQRHLRTMLHLVPSLAWLDGEVVAGHQYDVDSFRESMSGIRAEDGSPEFTFYGFDCIHPEVAYLDYETRRNRVRTVFDLLGGEVVGPDGLHAKLILCPQVEVRSLNEIYAQEERLLTAGWEGGILRNPFAPYKFGRSTYGDGALLKVKRFVEDAEAVVVGYEPWYTNANEATLDPRGYTTRSSHQDNLIPMERLGALKVELFTDRSVKFDIGVFKGWTHADRDELWKQRESLIGRIIKFKHQGYGGGYDKPRTPVGLGWRHSFDMS